MQRHRGVGGRERRGDPMTNPYYADRPIVAPPCRCKRPLYLGGEQCWKCGRRRPMKVELEDFRIRQL